MREHTLKTLEVFKYASSYREQWDPEALQRIDTQLIEDESLGRLSALLLQNTLENNQLFELSGTTQALLKTTATKIIMDVASKHHFIKQLVPLLESNGIPVILLKGMAFNHYLYDSNSPRGVSDIDILIKQEHKKRFKVIFSELASVIELDNKYAFDDLYEQAWRSNNNLHLIDVHTHLTNPILFDINSEAIWEHSIEHPAYLSNNVRVMSPEDTICHLVTHMINDTNLFHYNLIDIYKLVCKEEIDINLLESTALKWGVLNATKFALQAACNHLASPLILNVAQPHFLFSIRHRIASLVIKKLFTLNSNEKSFKHRLKQLCCYTFVVDKASLIFKISFFYMLSIIKISKR